MDQALVEDAEHQVDDRDRRDDEQRLLPLRLLGRERRALERAAHVGRHGDVGLGLADRRAGLVEGAAFGQVERDRRRELGVLVADRGRRRALAEARHGAERHQRVGVLLRRCRSTRRVRRVARRAAGAGAAAREPAPRGRAPAGRAVPRRSPRVPRRVAVPPPRRPLPPAAPRT
jgi:hypothetical protein